MHSLAALLLACVEICALSRLGRERGLLNITGLVGCLVICSQAAALLVIHDIARHDMMDVVAGADPLSDLYLAIWCAAGLFAGVWALERAVVPPFSAQAGSAGSQAPGPCAGPVAFMPWRTLAIWMVALASAATFAAAAATLDLERLWHTTGYLELTDPDLMTRGRISSLALAALPYCGAMSAAMTALALAPPRRPGLAAFAGVQAAATGLWLLSAHSRAAALPPLAFLLVTLLAAPARHAWLRITVALALFIATLGAALTGRGLRSHGVASLADTPALLADPASWLPATLINLAEGIFAVAAGIGEWRNAAPGVLLFPETYVWLSLSPLPSALDGFSGVLAAQVRLHPHAPMPGYVELAWFGPWPAATFTLIVAGAMRLAGKARQTAPLAGAGASLLIAACIYLMAAYPVRTSLKPLWISVGVSMTAMAATWPAARLRLQERNR